MWVFFDQHRERAITEEIDRQSDRGAAIIAAAFLEDRIEKAIREILIQDLEATDAFFDQRGPAATFASKIQLAYLLGLLTQRQSRTLQSVRRIRNLFAHTLEPIDFQNQEVTDLCRNLYDEQNIEPVRRRIKMMIEQSKSSLLPAMETWFAKIKETRDEPRQAYIHIIQLCVMQLSLNTRQSQQISAHMRAWQG